MKRRDFIKAAAAAMPLFYVGCASKGFVARRPAPGAPIRLGLIGCGSRMVRGLVTETAGERIVAACDADSARLDALKERLVKLKRANEIPGIRLFRDWRDLFDAVGDELDAVIVATPNHQHLGPALAAIRRGIGIYLEKPMTHTRAELEALMAAWRANPVPTQVGSHGHSNEGTRLLVDYVQSGLLGQVHDVWLWDCRTNAFPVLPPAVEPPPTLDWEIWQGDVPRRAYREGIHPHDWHYWKAWGNGAVGNTGPHFFDPPVWALKIDAKAIAGATARVVEAKPGAAESWNLRNTVEWRIPARSGLDPVTFHWYDGLKEGVPLDDEHLGTWGVSRKREWQHVPPVLQELERKYAMDLGREGFLVVGENGIIRMGASGGGFMFVPNNLKARLGAAPQIVPREKGFTHMKDFFRSVRGEREAGCNFAYAAPIAEMTLLGNEAILAQG